MTTITQHHPVSKYLNYEDHPEGTPIYEYLGFTYDDMSNPEILESVADTMMVHFDMLEEFLLIYRSKLSFQPE